MNGYSAKGDFKNAIKYAEKVMAQAPNDVAKKTLEGQIAKLKEGKTLIDEKACAGTKTKTWRKQFLFMKIRFGLFRKRQFTKLCIIVKR